MAGLSFIPHLHIQTLIKDYDDSIINNKRIGWCNTYLIIDLSSFISLRLISDITGDNWLVKAFRLVGETLPSFLACRQGQGYPGGKPGLSSWPAPSSELSATRTGRTPPWRGWSEPLGIAEPSSLVQVEITWAGNRNIFHNIRAGVGRWGIYLFIV